MRQKLALLKIVPCGLFLFLLPASSAAAIVAVDFGGDYTSSNINSSISPTNADVDADFDGSVDDRAATVPFGTTFTPPNSPNWTTPIGKSGGVIKHGISVGLIDWDSGPDPEPSVNLDRINDNDIIQVTNGAGTSSLRMASAFYWEKSSFINGADTAGVLSFADTAASVSIDFVNSGTPTTGSSRLSRALVQSNGSWYVSADVFGGTTGTLEINGATADWYVFDPQTGTLFLDENALGSTVSGSTLTDITAMGLYSQTQLIDGTAQNAIIQGFNGIQATMVPEPSTYALVSGGLLVVLLVIRRRFRRASGIPPRSTEAGG